MNQQDFESQFVEAFINDFKSGFKTNQFIPFLYDKFTEKSKKYNEELQLKNKILSDTIERIAEVFNVEYPYSYTLKDLDKNTQRLKDSLFKVKDSKGTKSTYLCYCGGDDCGHSFCDVILEKNMDHVQWAIEDESGGLEHIFYYDDSVLKRAVCERLHIDNDTFDKMSESTKTDAIEQFFQEIIEDDTISIRLFSEYAENLIGNNRHSGKSSKWIEI